MTETTMTKMPVALPMELKEQLREASAKAGRSMQDLIVLALLIMGSRDRLLTVAKKIDRSARRRPKVAESVTWEQVAQAHAESKHAIQLEVAALLHELQSWPDLTIPPGLERR